MRYLLLIAGMACACLPAKAQDGKVKKMYEAQEYETLTTSYGQHPEMLSPRSLYYVGMAYYLLEEDANCVKFMDKVIARDPKNARPHYIKGIIAFNRQQNDTAITDFKAAIALDSTVGEFYSELGDAYLEKQQTDLALDAFDNAAHKMKAPEHAYMMMANIYMDRNQPEKALEAYYNVKANMTTVTPSVKRALYNIGLLEMDFHRYDRSEAAFKNLLLADPNDYEAYQKLVRVAYLQDNPEKAKSYKTKLYEAHNAGKLHGALDDGFCIDVFDWNGKEVQAMERYQQGPSRSFFNKVVFYVNNGDQAERTVQLEYSALSIQQGGPMYVLCGNQGSTHYVYAAGFSEGYKYSDLKNAVLDVLNGIVQPVSSTKLVE